MAVLQTSGTYKVDKADVFALIDDDDLAAELTTITSVEVDGDGDFVVSVTQGMEAPVPEPEPEPVPEIPAEEL